MNASALPSAHAPTAGSRPALSTLAGQAGNVPLTRVALAYIEHRFKLYLRFGEPARGVTVAELLRALLEREFPSESTP